MSMAYAVLVSRAGVDKGAIDLDALQAESDRQHRRSGPRYRPPRARVRAVDDILDELDLEERPPLDIGRTLALDFHIAGVDYESLVEIARAAVRAYPYAPAAVWSYWLGKGTHRFDERRCGVDEPVVWRAALRGGLFEGFAWIDPAPRP